MSIFIKKHEAGGADAWGMEGHGYFFAGIFWGILKVLLSLRNGGVAILAIVAIIAMVDAVGGDGGGDGAGAMNRVPTI